MVGGYHLPTVCLNARKVKSAVILADLIIMTPLAAVTTSLLPLTAHALEGSSCLPQKAKCCFHTQKRKQIIMLTSLAATAVVPSAEVSLTPSLPAFPAPSAAVELLAAGASSMLSPALATITSTRPAHLNIPGNTSQMTMQSEDTHVWNGQNLLPHHTTIYLRMYYP